MKQTVKRAAQWVWWYLQTAVWAVRVWLPWKLSVLRYGWAWDRELAATHRLHRRMSRHYDKTGKVMVTSR